MANDGDRPLAGFNDAAAKTAALMGDLEAASARFGETMSRSLRQAVLDGKALDGVLKGLAQRFSDRMLARAFQPLDKALGDVLGGAVSALTGSVVGAVTGAAKGGRVTPFARGGVVAAPGYFPLPGGGTGLAGEAGAEAVMPLARGADGRLGVRGEGGGVQVVVNVTTADAESFRRSEAQLSAMLARAVGRGRRGL
ncbi:phage tail tape measure protein [Mongoliimonas terrestris]|uniref:phage tail tape measure protein n=1 Tax=Mongoliimonas terrestris TaxID=1709001 RepID=UPI0009496067|nr:phage tail tape measure protein [Mongoliimonas terrestris]